MHEADQLNRAIEKLKTCERDWDRPALERAVLLWGARSHSHLRSLEGLLTRQLEWLDSHEGHPNYELRFTDWICNLRLYERTWNMLAVAKGLNIGAPA